MLLVYQFSDETAFSRNIGWFSSSEQASLKNKRVAIAGLGGVGGAHLITLSRLGISAFNISDFDIFELQNFNRQSGAFCSTIDRKKIDVMTELALDINPNSKINKFNEGVNDSNLDDFLRDVDIYVDSLDFFCLEIRRKVFAKCREKGIPAITAAPLGMGSAFLYFDPNGMSFEEYFDFGEDEEDNYIKFLVGLSPSLMQVKYLISEGTVDFTKGKGPSTVIGCDLCAGVAGANAVKILLNRGTVLAAPYGYHVDAYLNRSKRTYRPWGNKNIIQKLVFNIAKKRISKK